jgi:putative hydrolase of the HAD superfamily
LAQGTGYLSSKNEVIDSLHQGLSPNRDLIPEIGEQLHRRGKRLIVYLPGAQAFLESARETNMRVLMVTNSHPDTLRLKNDTLGFAEFFDEIHSSHTYGHAKEKQAFWRALQEEEGFDPATTVFVDDTVPVLRSALEFGIRQSILITEPDTTEPPRENGEFPGVAGVRELI